MKPRVPNFRALPPRVELDLDVVCRFKGYSRAHPGGGAFHVVLDDGNVHDRFIPSAEDIEACHPCGDPLRAEALELRNLLERMSRTQRTKLGELVCTPPA